MESKTQELMDVVAPYLGEAAGVVGFSFAAMELSEEEIEKAQERWPEQGELLDQAFLVLRPRWHVFQGAGTSILRAHMRELLERLGEQGPCADLSLATAAEACMALSEVSMHGPLSHVQQMAYTVCFVEALGEPLARELLGDRLVQRAREDEGHVLVQEALGEVYTKMQDTERQEAWEEKVARLEVPHG